MMKLGWTHLLEVSLHVVPVPALVAEVVRNPIPVGSGSASVGHTICDNIRRVRLGV